MSMAQLLSRQWETPSLIALPVSATAWDKGMSFDTLGPGAAHGAIEQKPAPPRSPEFHRSVRNGASSSSSIGAHKRAWEAPAVTTMTI